ncbi:hypothetical protein MPLSOD_80263 [Mesorhizobium sp. SOD10]|nr:hypothetical protein MPLSOD_80263 [Mesorhizobium sp. SOD10]
MVNLKRIQSRCADHTPQPNGTPDVAARGVKYNHPGSAAHNRAVKFI